MIILPGTLNELSDWWYFMHSRFSLSHRGAVTVIAAVMLALGLTFAPARAYAEEQVSEGDTAQAVIEATESSDQESVADTQQADTKEVQVDTQEASNSDTESQGDSQVTVTITDDSTVELTVPGDIVEGAVSDNGEPLVTVDGEVIDGTASDDDTVTSGDATTDDDADAEKKIEEALTDPASQDDDTVLVLADPGEEIPEGDYIIESGMVSEDNTGLARCVLDARGSAKEGAQVISWTYNGGNNQKWHVSGDGTGWYVISSASDHSLVMTATSDGNKIYLTKYEDGLASQLWKFVLSGTAYGTGYQIVPKGIQKSSKDSTITSMLPSKALDIRGNTTDNGADIITYAQGSTPKNNQTYYLVNTNPKKPTSGVKGMEGKYRIQVPTNTDVVIEIRKASSDNGANVWLYTASGKTHQDIYLQHEGNGFYSLWVMGTEKVIDVRGSSILVGTNVIQWSYTGKDNQLWALRKNDDGTYSFINKATGLVLGVASASAGKKNNNIAGTQDNGRANNGFKLSRSKLISGGIYKIVALSDSKVLDVSKSSTTDGASIGFYTDNGGKNQRFQLVSAGHYDQWRIRTASSGGWVTLKGSSVKQQGNHTSAITADNTWHVIWRAGGQYMLVNENSSYTLGGSGKKLKFTSAAIPLTEGLVEIDAKIGGVVLDIPGSSTDSGVRINVYPDKDGENQKFIISKSGTGYKILSAMSTLALTANGSSNGSKVVQKDFTGDSTQIWTVGIADGGYVKLINKATKKALDITGSGSSIDNTKSTATQMYTSSDDREIRQSWKVITTEGFYRTSKNGQRYYTRSDGKTITISNACYSAYKSVQSYSSSSKYIMVIDNSNYRTFVFTGSKGKWKPYADWLCTVGCTPEQGGDETFGTTFRGVSYVRDKGYMMGNCPYEFYWTEFYINSAALESDGEGQRFHSILYWGSSPDSAVYDGTLGAAASHGCVRLATENAKWVYNNVPLGTTVWSY